jgi:hypothetical protein
LASCGSKLCLGCSLRLCEPAQELFRGARLQRPAGEAEIDPEWKSDRLPAPRPHLDPSGTESGQGVFEAIGQRLDELDRGIDVEPDPCVRAATAIKVHVRDRGLVEDRSDHGRSFLLQRRG